MIVVMRPDKQTALSERRKPFLVAFAASVLITSSLSAETANA